MEFQTAVNVLNPLFLYPTGAIFEQAERCAEVLANENADPGELFLSFSRTIRTETVEKLEELYISTFDMTRETPLDIGWLLFGEDYSRGTFLVRMRERLKRYNLPEGTELPDHLTHVLSIMGCMNDEELFDFATACVIPALRKCLDALKTETPYRTLLEGTLGLLEDHVGFAREDRSDV